MSEENTGEVVAEPVVEPVEGDPAPEPTEGEESPEGAEGEGEGDPPAEAAAEGDPEPEPEPKPKRKDWRESRIAELARKNGDLQRKLDAALVVTAKPEGDGEGPKTYTEEEVDRRATERAATIAEQAALTKACNDLFARGVETHADKFIAARDGLAAAFGDTLAARPDFLEALTELPNGHEVFFSLANDLDHAAEILALPSAKMGLRLAQLSTDAAKPKVRQVSGAPDPITPIRGSVRAEMDIDDPDLPMAEFVRRRNKQDKLRFN